MAKKMRTINNPLNRQTRNDINYNFGVLDNALEDMANSEAADNERFTRIENDVVKLKNEDKNLSDRIDANKQAIEDMDLDAIKLQGDTAEKQGIEAKKKGDKAEQQGNLSEQKGNVAEEQGLVAETKGIKAEQQGEYAKEMGDYAKEKAEYASAKTAEIEQAHTDLSQIKVEAVDATQNANTQANYAKEQAEYAKAVGDEVSDKLIDIENAKDTLVSDASDAIETVIEKGNITEQQGLQAEEQATYAKEQGDYAKGQAEYAAEKTAEIEQAHTDLSEIKKDAIEATDEASKQANRAKEEADRAKPLVDVMEKELPNIENLKHVGSWSESTEYKKNQEVLFNGSTYRALEDNKGTQPTDKSVWQLIAQRGVDGKGAVASVNGIMPDSDGNVDLGDIADKQYVDDKIGDVDLSVLETKTDAIAKLEEAKEYTDTKISEIPEVDLSHLETKTDSNNKFEAVEDLIDNHATKKVGETEVHGMRVNNNNEFQFFKNGEWHTIEGGGTISVATVSELKVTSDDEATELTITWSNPVNDEFQRTEIYKSEKLLNVKNPEEIISQSELIYAGTDEIIITSTQHDETTYIYAIAYHVVVGVEVMSDVIMVSITAKDINPPDPITDFTLSAGDRTITGAWTNPTDADFEKVKIVYKTEGYPINEFDGMVAYEGSSTSFEVTGLINGTEYFFRAFTFDKNGNKNDDETQMAQATPASYVLYGVEIDENNPDPFGAVKYIEESADFEPLFSGNETVDYGSWEDKFPLNKIKVVLLKNGEVVEELDKNDYRKTVDGRSVDITSGDAGDVMVGLPLTYWKFNRVGTKLRVYVSDGQPDDDFKAYAHSRDGIVQDEYLYVGAFKGTVQEGKLRSLHDAMSTASETVGKFREYANSNGLGYGQMNWATMTLLQIYSVLLSKSLDSQTALGEGYTNNNSEYIKNGATVAKGLFYGESSGKEQMKFLGLEDFYGNRMEWVDGLVTDSSRNILINDKNVSYNDAGVGYAKHGECFNKNGYIKTIEGTTGTGFLPTDTNGSSSTYYCDNAYQSGSGGRVAYFGGHRSNGSFAGAFRLVVDGAPSDSSAVRGARCLFLKFLKDDI